MSRAFQPEGALKEFFSDGPGGVGGTGGVGGAGALQSPSPRNRLPQGARFTVQVNTASNNHHAHYGDGSRTPDSGRSPHLFSPGRSAGSNRRTKKQPERAIS